MARKSTEASPSPPVSSPKSKTVAMLGWLRAAAARASRRKRARCSGFASLSWRNTFTATMRPSSESLARYTSPMPPAPMRSRIW